ncbi:Macrophage killing protein with similarity to conjugation protein [Legionella lansingensis]|uniref:Macrophage killing protein with similarity to conjugation protein n=1 Tax=Legionella lansingensis TaxID=45067 RepID=A0A0W0VG74_9GAMM|nr:DotI/IcmL/TraM family protein [Legionella lansingensis]KTD19127.1 Macrophage killing protein with similarity to conjugation protein [Legionella lansingensis]SNV45611.1 Macrophage killing protein with similarity to conjugation protein [Legionella lansingensis]
MNFQFLMPLILSLTLFLPSISRADDAAVTAWAEQVLYSTLTFNYAVPTSEVNTIRANYSPNAWDGLQTFFSQQIQMLKDQKIIPEPQSLGPAVIVEKGIIYGTNYWRVNKDYYFPAINRGASFSLFIVQSTNPPYIIQSLSVDLK